MRIELTCSTCGVSFWRYRSQVEGVHRHFCSEHCRINKIPPTIEHRDGGDVALIPLLAKDGSIRAHVIVDAADVAWATQWRWSLNKNGYAQRDQRRGGDRRVILMHRELLGLQTGDEIEGDHINRNRLDNRRSNLRAVSKIVNRQNLSSRTASSSRFRGVSWRSDMGKWVAQVSHGRTNHYLGCFENEIDAAEAARQGRMRLLSGAVD